MNASGSTPPAEAEDDNRLKVAVLDHLHDLVDVRSGVPLPFIPPAATAAPPAPAPVST